MGSPLSRMRQLVGRRRDLREERSVMLLFLDFETYYDRDYSLKKLTPAEYILDERYETICLSYAIGDGPVQFVDGPLVADFIASLDPQQTTTVTFNALFDNAILAWRYHF